MLKRLFRKLKKKFSGTVFIIKKEQQTKFLGKNGYVEPEEVFVLGKKVVNPRHQGPYKIDQKNESTSYGKISPFAINTLGQTDFVEVAVDKKCVSDWGETVAIYFKPKLEGGDLV